MSVKYVCVTIVLNVSITNIWNYYVIVIDDRNRMVTATWQYVVTELVYGNGFFLVIVDENIMDTATLPYVVTQT